jgi:hypothetical protein
MTLIGIATYGNSAEFITDTLSYSANLHSLGHTTKSQVLTHIDTAVLTQGSSAFAHLATAGMAAVAAESPTFDSLVAEASEALRVMWASRADGDWGRYGATVFLIGYSPEVEAFRAFSFAHDRDDFAAERLDAPHIMPAPYSVAPSDMELRRLTNKRPESEGHAKLITALKTVWPAKPGLAAPKNKTQWQELAKQCREQRALDPSRARTLVGGNVHHTRLSRGKVSTHIIHTYDDSGDEFLRMIADSDHPQVQLAPCPCASRKTFRECCLIPFLSEDCRCDSGETFEECCAVEVAVETVAN